MIENLTCWFSGCCDCSDLLALRGLKYQNNISSLSLVSLSLSVVTSLSSGRHSGWFFSFLFLFFVVISVCGLSLSSWSYSTLLRHCHQLHYPELTIFVIKSLLGSLLSTTANYREITRTKGIISTWKLCNEQFRVKNQICRSWYLTLYTRWPAGLPWWHFTTVVPPWCRAPALFILQ